MFAFICKVVPIHVFQFPVVPQASCFSGQVGQYQHRSYHPAAIVVTSLALSSPGGLAVQMYLTADSPAFL